MKTKKRDFHDTREKLQGDFSIENFRFTIPSNVYGMGILWATITHSTPPSSSILLFDPIYSRHTF